MQNFLKRTDVQRKTIYEQIALRVGISDPRAIEKDMWVTSLLQVVFGLPYADKFVFKGGSSLSKVWKLIHRFSEDIDLAMDRSLFGLEGDLTKKQLKKLRKESSLFVKEKLASDIAASLHGYGSTRTVKLSPNLMEKETAHILSPGKFISHINPCSIAAMATFARKCFLKSVPAHSLSRHQKPLSSL